MNFLEAQAITRLAHHLDGSIPRDPELLAADVQWLAWTAGRVNGFPVRLSSTALQANLAAVTS